MHLHSKTLLQVRYLLLQWKSHPVAESSRSGSRLPDDEKSSERNGFDRRKRQKREPREDDEAKREKRLAKLVGDVVVRSMSKYKDQMDHDTFKRYAREVRPPLCTSKSCLTFLQCTTILVEKEKKGHTYSTARQLTLSDEKKAKIKSFTKDYAHKLLKRLKERGKLRRPTHQPHTSTAASVSGPTSTPLASATPATISTPSAILATPPDGTQDSHGDLVIDIFGGSDDEEDDMMLDEDDTNGSPLIMDLATPGSADRPAFFSPSSEKTNGAIRVDSFRPATDPAISNGSLSMETPSRTPTSGSGPSPQDRDGRS